MKDVQTVLVLIALQQGLCAFSWWVGGWWLGLPKKVSVHWVSAALLSAAGLSLILERGVWPDFLTLGVANAAVMASFILMRRGIQLFLRIRLTDREQASLFAFDVIQLGAFFVLTEHRAVGVVLTSFPLAWTLLRAAHESHRALVAEGALATARVVATPLALMGLLYVVRIAAGIVAPGTAARELHEATTLNSALLLAFMLVGLVLNLVLALMVVGRLVSRLQHLSERDALTGLLNRRALLPLMQREAGRLRRHQENYALLMIDIDHFKAINDRHGHAAGDATLVRLATLLREAAREVDHVARLGGEEFCILLPGTDMDGAMRLAQRVHQAVRSASWEQIEPITISVGVAVVQSSAELPQAALERADEALYRAKNSGRDRVVLAEPSRFGELRSV